MPETRAIEAYLETGEVNLAPWSGCVEAAGRQLRDLLVRIVQFRAKRAPLRRRLPADTPRRIARRAGPLLHGLLQPEVRRAFQDALPDRIRVVTADTLAPALAALDLADAWALANIVLEDMCAPPLSDDALQLDGLCIDGRVWVPAGALSPPTDRVDVIAHEVAHLLHSLEHHHLGLSEPGVLVPVPEPHVETFAYACELHACLLRTGRWGQADLLARESHHADARVDPDRVRRALIAAQKHGWKAIVGITTA